MELMLRAVPRGSASLGHQPNRASTATFHVPREERRPALRVVSRSSTDRASAITLPTTRRRNSDRSPGVSVVNRPSKRDHRHLARLRYSLLGRTACLGRQPTEQVQSRVGDRQDRAMTKSQPSTDRASTITRGVTASQRSLGWSADRRRGSSLGRQLTEQVRSYPPPIIGRQPSASACANCLGRQPTEQVRSRLTPHATTSATPPLVTTLRSRSSTNRASTITGSHGISLCSLGRQPTAQVRSQG